MGERESVLYLGRRYVLKVIPAPEQRKVTCKLIGGQLRVQGKELTAERIQKSVRQWYRDRAVEVFQRRLDLMVDCLPWTTTGPAWRMMEMQTQWGELLTRRGRPPEPASDQSPYTGHRLRAAARTVSSGGA